LVPAWKTHRWPKSLAAKAAAMLNSKSYAGPPYFRIFFAGTRSSPEAGGGMSTGVDLQSDEVIEVR